MELDELIRVSVPVVGPAPTVGDLRAGARRRSVRRVRAIGAAVVVAVVAVLVPLLLPGDETNSTVAVRPQPVGRTLSSWSKIGTIPDPGSVTNPVNVDLVASGSRMFVVAWTDNLATPSENWVRVWSVEPASGELTDLSYGALRPVGSHLESVVGWQGGPVIVVTTPDGWSIDHWVESAWTTLERPDAPADALRAPHLSTFGSDLAASLPVGTPAGMTGERVWSTVDGRSWTDLPEPPDHNGYGAYTGGASLVRQGFSPQPTDGSLTALLLPGRSDWTVVPTPAFPSYGSLLSAEIDGVLVSCGSQSSEAHYDCSRWTPGDDTQRTVDPPPFLQGQWQERLGERISLVAVPGRGVVMSDDRDWALYEPQDDRWHRLPRPPSVGGTRHPVVAEGDVYAVMADLRQGPDDPITFGVYRLEVGEDDPEVRKAIEVGDGYRVRLPSDRWDAGVPVGGPGLSVGTRQRVKDASGGECPALQVDFVEGTAPGAPSPYAPLDVPGSTPPCEPMVFTTMGGGRQFTMLVYRSGPTTPDDSTELTQIIGSFRAAVR